MSVRVGWRWFDLWVGAYWDRAACVLYVCPLPTLCIRIELDRGNVGAGRLR